MNLYEPEGDLLLRVILTLLGMYSACVVQTSVLPMLRAGVWTPQLLLWGLVLSTWRLGPREGLLVAALWGFLSDCLSGGTLGIDVICCVLAAAAVQRLRGNESSILTLSAATGAVVAWTGLASPCLRLRFSGQPVPLQALSSAALCAAFSTAALALTAGFLWRLFVRPSRGLDSTQSPRVSNHWRMLTD